jgi:hypothetical protein
MRSGSTCSCKSYVAISFALGDFLTKEGRTNTIFNIALGDKDSSGSPAGVGGNDLFEYISSTDRGRGMGGGLYRS